MPKKKVASKTLWINALYAATTMAEAQSGLLQSQFGNSVYFWLLISLAAINYALRHVTSQPIE